MALAACSGRDSAAPWVVDLLAQRGEELGAAEVFCRDRLQYGVEIGAGERLTVELDEAPGSPVLIVGGCTRRQGQLDLFVDGSPLAEVRDGGWWERRLAVTAAGTLELRATGSPVVIADLALRGRQRLEGRRTPAGPQVLLISVDTLRADALGAYGAPPGSTPALDALAAEAEIHERHYAASNWSKPSHATLLSGAHPWTHGAVDEVAVINSAVPMLAETLRHAGLATGGLVRHVWLDERFGFARGFDEYQVVDWQAHQQRREAVRWITRHREVPFFYFLHLMTVHSDFVRLPYEARGVDRRWVEERFGVENYGCRNGRCASLLLQAYDRGELEPEPGEEEILRALYAAGVAEVDAELGRFFDDLRGLGVFDNLTVVLTSDHGEALLEHGAALHSTWWEQVLRVPLLVRWPQGRGGGQRLAGPSAAVDIAPTLLAALDLPHAHLPGRPLRGRRPDLPVFSGVSWQAVIVGADKAVYFPSEPPLLFDLAADPAEHHDLADERPERLAELDTLRQQARKAFPLPTEPSPGAALSPEEEARLRALGYLGN